ncbi:MAG: hypothetical protein H6814_09365 [Phycisphaeraceae bacterium]|nr:hypothetical protein [Phycisphaeraceae bacterium]
MSTTNPDPYDIDGADNPFGPSGHVEVFAPQGEVDDRARSPRMDAIALEPGRKCVSCGYDLTGLYVGGNCPECGDKILSVAPNPDNDAIKRMPEWYLRVLGVALWGLAISGALVIVAEVMILIQASSWATSSNLLHTFVQVVALTWFVGILALCCPPPEKEPRLGIGRSRWELAISASAALSQVGVLVALLHPLLVGAVNIQLLLWSANIAFYGLFLVALQGARIAWRLNDEDRAHRLQTAGLSIPLGAGMVYVFGEIIGAHVPFLSLFGVPFLVIQVIGTFLWIWGNLYLLWSFVNLGQEAFWAISNTHAAQARIERMKDRARAEFEQAQREREDSQPYGGPIS